MRKPVVAIIDSGISSEFGYHNDVIGGVGFCTEKHSVFMTDEFEDHNGHGTQCSYVIKKYCPEALLYIVKILDDKGRGSSLLLLLALKHLLDVDADIVNISLSISDTQYIEEISSMIQLLKRQRKIVIVSVPNGKETGMPAASNGCFGIKSSDTCHGLIYDASAPVQVTVRAFPEFAESIKGQFEWFGGNSCSAAALSGTAANVLKKLPKGSDTTAFFESYLEKYQSTLFLAQTNEAAFNEEIGDLFIKCRDIFRHYIECSDISLETVLIAGNKIMTRDAYGMIKECGKKLGVDIPCEKLSNTDFFDIKHFLTFIQSVSHTSISLQKNDIVQ